MATKKIHWPPKLTLRHSNFWLVTYFKPILSALHSSPMRSLFLFLSSLSPSDPGLDMTLSCVCPQRSHGSGGSELTWQSGAAATSPASERRDGRRQQMRGGSSRPCSQSRYVFIIQCSLICLQAVQESSQISKFALLTSSSEWLWLQLSKVLSVCN